MNTLEMDVDLPAQQNVELHLPDKQLAVTFESITFSDGTNIEIDPTDVLVLVGPNNAGKSLALRELEAHIGSDPPTIVVASAKQRHDGTGVSFEEFVRANAHVSTNDQGSSLDIQGYGISLSMGRRDLQSFWPSNIRSFRSLFLLAYPYGESHYWQQFHELNRYSN